MHPYWRLPPGGVVVPAGVDDPDPEHATLDGLLADLGGLAADPAEPGPEAVVEPSALAPDVLAAFAIVAGTMLAVAVLFAVVVIAARRGRVR
jgi:hypothetical protein